MMGISHGVMFRGISSSKKAEEAEASQVVCLEVCMKKEKSGYLGNEPRRQRAGLVALFESAIKSCPFNRNKSKNKQMGHNQTCKLMHSKEKQKTIYRMGENIYKRCD